jgi:hypothetical protein
MQFDISLLEMPFVSLLQFPETSEACEEWAGNPPKWRGQSSEDRIEEVKRWQGTKAYQDEKERILEVDECHDFRCCSGKILMLETFGCGGRSCSRKILMLGKLGCGGRDILLKCSCPPYFVVPLTSQCGVFRAPHQGLVTPHPFHHYL